MNGAELAGVAIAGLLMCPLGILFGSLLGTLPDNCCERGKPERVVAAPVPQQEMQPVKNNEQPKIPPPRGLPPQIAQKPADYNTQIENMMLCFSHNGLKRDDAERIFLESGYDQGKTWQVLSERYSQ